jgi:hypothetical protein
MLNREIDRYAKLMNEVRMRMETISDLISGRTKTTYIQTNIESICLQFRKILELIAFGSLVCHNKEYSAVRAITKDWHAARILKAVEQINPDFYPIPVRGWVGPDRNGQHKLAMFRGVQLTRIQFAALYDQCGQLLHSQNPFTRHKSSVSFLNRAPNMMHRVQGLLSEHVVTLPLGKDFLWVHIPQDQNLPIQVQHVSKLA